MPRHPSSSTAAIRRTALWIAVILCVNAGAAPASGAEHRTPPAAAPSEADLAALGWVWPSASFRMARAYIAPAHEYGPGHRGIDLAPIGTVAVLSPADGVVAFAGQVAGRGILTIDHGGGLVTTLEPVETTAVPGMTVGRGEEVATLAIGGHAERGTLHFGVRLDGRYINPMLLLGGVPRAILLPCCA